MTEKSAWEQVLAQELEALEPVPRMIRYSELIMYVTRELLARLAEERRDLLLQILEDPAIDDTALAEMIGTRRTTIRRLKVEARARLRERG